MMWQQTINQILFFIIVIYASCLIIHVQSIPYHHRSFLLPLSSSSSSLDPLENAQTLSITPETSETTILFKTIQPQFTKSSRQQQQSSSNTSPTAPLNPLMKKSSFQYDLNNYTIKPTFYQYVKSCCNREVMRPMGGGHMTGPCCKQLIKFNHFIWLSFPWFKKTLTKLTTTTE
ncbi:unnamed protein product [Schistosoma turkestanicum]|nr:unnamed protein product [Schistosoma turkestanicum]